MNLEVLKKGKWEIRTIKKEGEIWFIASDVASILNYKEPHKAIQRHCKHAKILKRDVSSLLEIPPRGFLIIPESDVFRLCVKSNLPEAENFEEWVFEDVLPSIRKTGSYNVKQMSPAEISLLQSQALVEQEKKVIALEAKTEKMGQAVMEIQHTIMTNGCRPGYIPQRDAHMMYGQSFSYDMFKKIMKHSRIPRLKYSYKTPDGNQGYGWSVKQDLVLSSIKNFMKETSKVTQHFYSHPAFGEKRFKVFKEAV